MSTITTIPQPPPIPPTPAAGARVWTKGYSSGEWATYRQWTEKGAQVRKGEKSSTVVLWKWDNNAHGDDSETKGHSRLLFTTGYAVFNAEQVDGYTPKVEPIVSMNQRVRDADAFFDSLGATVRHGGNRAYYQPSDDRIQMPKLEQFIDSTHYYSTEAHEFGHWTGHPSRLDRKTIMKARFGDMDYAAEELVAEFTAAFTCALLGFGSSPREDHAQYIQNWLTVLKADNKAVFVAASKAQAAVDFMKQLADGKQSDAAEQEKEGELLAA